MRERVGVGWTDEPLRLLSVSIPVARVPSRLGVLHPTKSPSHSIEALVHPAVQGQANSHNFGTGATGDCALCNEEAGSLPRVVDRDGARPAEPRRVSPQPCVVGATGGGANDVEQLEVGRTEHLAAGGA
eukprot:scaffold9087_cov119-Isochrysis_galbana.AAC.7